MAEKKLMVVVGANINEFSKAMSTIEKQMKGVEKNLAGFTQIGKRMASIGKQLTLGVTLPIVAVGTAALKSSIDFESAFAGVRKTVNATEPELAALRKGILDMTREIPQSAEEIAGIAEAAGQLGIQTPHILSFTRVMADLGVATNLTGADAATALARLANITQMDQKLFDKLGSTVVALGNALATTEAEIVEMGLRIAGAGHTVGMTEAQILGFAGALSSVGIEAQAGGSSISKVMINIASAVAKGEKFYKDYADVAGMSAKQFKQAWEKDAAGAIITFIEGLGKMQKEGGNVFGVLEELGLREVRVRDAMLRAAGAGDLFRQSLELGTKSWAENSALTKEATQRYKTTESQLKILGNYARSVGIALGDTLAPSLIKVIDALKPLLDRLAAGVKWFSELPTGVQQSAIMFVGMVAALGPVLNILGNVLVVVPKIAAAFKGISLVIGGIRWASLLANPVTLAIGGVIVAVGLLYKAWTENWGGIQEKTRKVIDWLTDKWTRFKALFTGSNIPAPSLPSMPTGFVPAMAGGGYVSHGGMALVGERGPELVNLPTGANVTPSGGLSGDFTVRVLIEGAGASRVDRATLTRATVKAVERAFSSGNGRLHDKPESY